jgi:hypothetical protein
MDRPLWSRTTSFALAFAAVWSAVLVLAAFVLPVYGTSSASSTGDASGNESTSVTTTGTATLVGVNGLGVLLVIGFPLLITLLVGAALAARRRRLGWVITGVLCFVTVILLTSIGLFVAPTTLALVVACAATERVRVAHPADDPSPQVT